MTAARLIMKNMAEFNRQAEKANTDRKKAAEVATYTEAIRLRKDLKEKIRKGTIPGTNWPRKTALSQTGELMRTGRMRYKKPYANIHKMVSVRYERGGLSNYTVHVGFLQTGHIARILTLAQTRATIPVTARMRRFFQKTAVQYLNVAKTKKGHVRKPARYFFIKRTTTHFTRPGRPIIHPYWRSVESESVRNIRLNFERKMAGERI